MYQREFSATMLSNKGNEWNKKVLPVFLERNLQLFWVSLVTGYTWLWLTAFCGHTGWPNVNRLIKMPGFKEWEGIQDDKNLSMIKKKRNRCFYFCRQRVLYLPTFPGWGQGKENLLRFFPGGKKGKPADLQIVPAALVLCKCRTTVSITPN